MGEHARPLPLPGLLQALPAWPRPVLADEADGLPGRQARSSLVPEKAPRNVSFSPERGIEMTFTGGMGKMAVLPLFGRFIPKAAETERWLERFPKEVASRCDDWASALARVPDERRGVGHIRRRAGPCDPH